MLLEKVINMCKEDRTVNGSSSSLYNLVTELMTHMIETDQQVLRDNTMAMSSLTAIMTMTQKTLDLLVSQVTINIAQSRSGVPLKIFMIVVSVMAILIVMLIGLNVADVPFLGG